MTFHLTFQMRNCSVDVFHLLNLLQFGRGFHLLHLPELPPRPLHHADDRHALAVGLCLQGSG